MCTTNGLKVADHDCLSTRGTHLGSIKEKQGFAEEKNREVTETLGSLRLETHQPATSRDCQFWKNEDLKICSQGITGHRSQGITGLRSQLIQSQRNTGRKVPATSCSGPGLVWIEFKTKKIWTSRKFACGGSRKFVCQTFLLTFQGTKGLGP